MAVEAPRRSGLKTVLGVVAADVGQTRWAVRTHRVGWSLGLLVTAIAAVVALQDMGLNARMLSAFGPDFALVAAAALVSHCLPVVLRAGARVRRFFTGEPEAPQT